MTCRPKCLDRVLLTTARLVGHIPRFGRVFGYMRDVLHWLPYLQCTVYRVPALNHLCTPCLLELCFPTKTFEHHVSLDSSAYTDCLTTAPCLLCGWSDPLECSPGCAVPDTSGLPCSVFSGLHATFRI